MKAYIGLLYILFFLLAGWVFFLSSDKLNTDSNETQNLSPRLTKVEFYQEATRIRDNELGFKQVDISLPSKTEKKKNCEEGKDLLSEWNEDLNLLKNNFSQYLGSNQEAKSYFDEITKIHEDNIASCNSV